MDRIQQLEPPNKENTGCVVVTYNPDSVIPDRVNKAAKQIDAILVVDNGSNESVEPLLNELTSIPNLSIIKNNENIGLGAALNQGLSWAKDRGYQWLLTLDQDTLPYDSMMEDFHKVFADHPQKRNIAIIGSNYIDRNLDEYLSNDINGSFTEVETVITSGCLVSLINAEIIGQFREDFFIDQIDFEYCLRAQSKGMKVLLTNKPLMEHGIGIPKKCVILGKQLLSPNVSLSRHYYQTRNHLTLCKEYIIKNPKWVARSSKVRIKEIILMLLCETDRIQKVKMILTGALHALIGRLGPYSDRR